MPIENADSVRDIDFNIVFNIGGIIDIKGIEHPRQVNIDFNIGSIIDSIDIGNPIVIFVVVIILLSPIYYYVRQKLSESVKINIFKVIKNILCNLAYTFKVNEKFPEKLQNESSKVANHYVEKRETLEARIGGDFPDSVTVDQEAAKLLLSISSKKAISALEQFIRGEMFLRIKLFKEFWEEAVQSSSSYLSICDLSIYSGKDESEIGSEKVNWERRIKDEIKALTEGETKKFDKIILCERDSERDDKNLILKAVKDAWLKEIKGLKSAGIKSHCAGKGGQNNMIWMACHDKFSDKISAINGSHLAGQINSNDLGIFGDDLIGEEFKVSKEPKLSKGANHAGWRETEFLYRINANPAIVEEVRSTITRMITDGEIENIA